MTDTVTPDIPDLDPAAIRSQVAATRARLVAERDRLRAKRADINDSIRAVSARILDIDRIGNAMNPRPRGKRTTKIARATNPQGASDE